MPDQDEEIQNPIAPVPVDLPPVQPESVQSDKSLKAVSGESAPTKFIQDIVIGVVFVLFIGFATMFVAAGTLVWQAWTEKAATYQNLVDKVNLQNEKIDQLKCQVEKTNSATSTC